MKTLSIGKLKYDINILLDSYPNEGSNTTTKEMISCSGGSANIVAYALGKWNMESFISGVVGYDETGNTMKKNMEENHVRTTFLETNYDIKTPTSYIMMNNQNKSKTVINTNLNQFNIKKFDYDQIMDCIIVDGHEYNASSFAFTKFNNAISILNAKSLHQGLLDFFKFVKYVVCSQEVAEKIIGIKIDFNNPETMSVLYNKMIDKYPHINLLIKIPEKGTIYSVNNEIKIVSAINTEILDDTGAYDVFVAMIAHGLTNNYDIETTIRLATIAESISKKKIGSTLSIPILSDIINYYENRFGPIKEIKSDCKEKEQENNLSKESLIKEIKPEISKVEEPMINPFMGTIISDNQNNSINSSLNTTIIQNQNEQNSKSDSNAPTT